MSKEKELDQLIELKAMVGDLIKSKKRFIQLSKKRSDMCMSTHTARSIENANANLDFHAMEYDKLFRDVHACAVDCGIASPRDNYDTVEYNISAYHRYSYQPRIPLCCQPKNGVTDRMILANFGYPWPLVAMWSQCNQQWVAATISVQSCDGKQDPYFESEWFDDDELISWREIT